MSNIASLTPVFKVVLEDILRQSRDPAGVDSQRKGESISSLMNFALKSAGTRKEKICILVGMVENGLIRLHDEQHGKKNFFRASITGKGKEALQNGSFVEGAEEQYQSSPQALAKLRKMESRETQSPSASSDQPEHLLTDDKGRHKIRVIAAFLRWYDKGLFAERPAEERMYRLNDEALRTMITSIRGMGKTVANILIDPSVTINRIGARRIIDASESGLLPNDLATALYNSEGELALLKERYPRAFEEYEQSTAAAGKTEPWTIKVRGKDSNITAKRVTSSQIMDTESGDDYTLNEDGWRRSVDNSDGKISTRDSL